MEKDLITSSSGGLNSCLGHVHMILNLHLINLEYTLTTGIRTVVLLFFLNLIDLESTMVSVIPKPQAQEATEPFLNLDIKNNHRYMKIIYL